MKFAEYLWAHLTPEWYSQYIEYDEMKGMLAESVAEAEQLIAMNDSSARGQFFLQADEQFFRFCEKEASKINTFFAEKLAEALRLLEPLKNELDNIQQIQRVRHGTNTSMYSMHIAEANCDENDSDNRMILTKSQRPNAFKAWLTRMKPEKSIETMRKIRVERTRHRKINDLKLAFSEFYLMLVLLKNYQTLNSTGFRKILKKHDKLFQTTRGDEWRKVHIDSTPFHTSRRIDELISEVETLFTSTLESGNRTLAMQRLRVPPLEEKQPHMVTFRVGIFVGMLCLLVPMVIILSITLRDSKSNKPLAWRPALHLYRPSFLVILHIILVGINVYGWSHSGVNHILIFEIDPRNHLTYQKFLEIGTFIMTLWFLSFIAFIVSSYYDVQPFAQPLAFTIFLILLLINPTRTFYYHSRRWLLKNLGRVVLSPWYHVNFTAFWLGDQLTSLELIFFDVQYFICFYIYDVNWTHSTGNEGVFCAGWSQFFLQTIFIILPSWFRFAQCLRRYRDTKLKFPHLVNAGKYASTFLVAVTNSLRRSNIVDYQHHPISNPFLYLWIITSLISSTYKVAWDLKMDWGFLDKNAGQNKYLREQIVYSSKAYYYAAIIQNILFRYIWMINIFTYFATSTAEYADIIGFTFAIIEIVRRFIWNYFRLENEHLNNCGDFRAVRDISIQMTTSIATGYSKRLQTIGTQSNVEDQYNAKRRQTIVSEEKMTAMAKKRRETIVNAAFDDESINSQSLTAKAVAIELNARVKSVSSNPNSQIVVNPYRSQTLPT